jgi:hypothetical protein
MPTETASLGSLPGAECTLPIPDTPAWREAAREGIDLALLFRNLRLSPERRMMEHAAARRFAAKIRGASRQRPGGRTT